MYPDGGTKSLAEALIPSVEASGGRVLIRAKVGEITSEDGHVNGVIVRSTTKKGREWVTKEATIKAPVVVAACGYRVAQQLAPSLAPLCDDVTQSDGFLMVNLGINASAESLGLKCSNTWVHPLNEANGFDLFECIRAFEADPHNLDPPLMITFPSIKDRTWSKPDRATCQILVLAKRKWFEPCGQHGSRPAEYVAMKKQWADRCIGILLKQHPELEGHLKLVDVSTPASIEHWLGSTTGCATGLDCVPARFSATVQDQLQMKSRMPGLWLTGQDTFICGVPMAQIAGLITALRIAGGWATCKFLAGNAKMLLRGFLLGA